MKHRPWTIALAVCCFSLVLSSAASAQSVCPEATSPEQARRLAGEIFADAEELFGASDFRAAINRFECSYNLVPHPSTLFNIARTAEELDDLPLALVTYRSYLERFVDSTRRQEVEQRVRELEEQLAAMAPEDRGTSDDPDDGGGIVGPVDPQPPVELRMSTPRLFAWISLGLGLGSTGGGLYGAAVQRSDEYRAAEARGAPQVVRDELVAEGQAFETAGWILIGTGGALFITSLVLFFAFDAQTPVNGSDEQQAGLWPLFGPGVLGLGGQF